MKEYLSIQQVSLREIPQGEYFTLNEPTDDPNENLVWVRGAYDRTDKSYYCYKYADVNHERAMKGSRKVWVGFCF